MLQMLNPAGLMANPEMMRMMLSSVISNPDMQAELMNKAVEFVESTKITEIQCWASSDAVTAESPTVAGAFSLQHISSPASFVQTMCAHIFAELDITFGVIYDMDEGLFVGQIR